MQLHLVNEINPDKFAKRCGITPDSEDRGVKEGFGQGPATTRQSEASNEKATKAPARSML
jgi:hypothetical protein